MNDKLHGVNAFVRVVEAGSFALAAEHMNLTRSAVGKMITRLEARLGVRLLERTTRAQRLTEDGQTYYDRCTRALAELDAAEAELESGRREPRGRLRVSVPLAFGHHYVAPVLAGLARTHPQLQVEISFSDRRVDLVTEGFDLVVRIGELVPSDSLVARALGVQVLGLGAAPAYLARYGIPTTLEELEQHLGIVYSRTDAQWPWQMRDDKGRLRQVHLRPQLSLDDVQAMADAAIAGHGLALLPSWLRARYVDSGQLVPVMDDHRMQPQPIHVIWLQTRHLPPKIRCAVDALVTEIPARIACAAPSPSSGDKARRKKRLKETRQ